MTTQQNLRRVGTIFLLAGVFLLAKHAEIQQFISRLSNWHQPVLVYREPLPDALDFQELQLPPLAEFPEMEELNDIPFPKELEEKLRRHEKEWDLRQEELEKIREKFQQPY